MKVFLLCCALMVMCTTAQPRSLLFHGEHVEDTMCVLCNSTSYCTGGQQLPCMANSVTDPQQYPSELGDCVCVGGYKRVGDVCEVGVPPYFYEGGIQKQCPAHMLTLTNLASSSQDCVCREGYGLVNGVCVICAKGTFKGTHGNETCTPCAGGFFANVTGSLECLECPVNTFATGGNIECEACRDNSQSVPGSDSPNDCLCNVGYFFETTGDYALECVSCAEGKYKNTVDLDGSCFDCPVASNSPATSDDITDCTCNIGFTGADGEVCTACELGKFKNVTGDAACESCAENTFANATASTVCFDCMPDSTSPVESDHVDDCVCDTGHARIASELEPECSSCAPGKFAGASGCENCTGGTYSNEYGMTACLTCPDNSASYITPHVDCQCDAGYKCNGGLKTCPSGDCIPCDTNTFADTPGYRSACSACQNHSQSMEASDHQDDCQCSPGYFEASDHVCEPCAPGTFTSILDASECTLCQGDYKFTPVVPIDSQDDCQDCALCPDDQYDDAPCSGLTASDCQNCPLNSGTLQSATASNPNIGITSCSCDADFYGVLGGPCDVCQPPKVCDPSSWTLENDNPHDPDRICMDMDSDEDSCSIKIAQQGNTKTCNQLCADQGLLCAWAYQVGSWGLDCIKGPWLGCDTVSTFAGSMICNCGLIAPAAEKVRTAGRVATDTTHQDCHCQIGHYHVSDILCEPCQVGSYKDVAGDDTTCTACADGFTTLTTGSTSVNDCLCPSGHFLDGNSCTACPENTFKDVISNATACTACRNHSVAGLGSTQEIQCECQPGWYLSGGVCVECAPGSTKSNVSNNACTPCPPDTFMPDANSATSECLSCPSNESTHGSSGNAQCSCVAGMEFAYQCDTSTWPDVNTQCGGCEVLVGDVGDPRVLFDSKYETCAAYCESFGRTCTGGRGRASVYGVGEGEDPCDPSTWNGGGSEMTIGCHERKFSYIQICECSSDIGSCAICPDNEFRTDVINTQTCTECYSCRSTNWRVDLECTPTQNRVCKQCQANSNLPFGDETSTFCHCNAGYEADEANDKCNACEVGKYKTTNSNNSIPCQTCETGKKALSTAMTECDNCEPNCPAVDGVERYVSAECTPTSSIVCTECTPCAIGFYSRSNDSSTTDTTCGVHYNNDRSDTQCVQCEETFFCVDGVRFSCGEHTFSPVGSSASSHCKCLPGFFPGLTGCQVCPRDTYCPDGELIHCPTHSINNYEQGTHVLDCNCLHGYHRVDETDSFTCALCAPDDYCFNNSAYDCPDDRQVAQAGSSSITHCLCTDGFFNSEDDTQCFECPIDSYCTNGTRYVCAADRWTFNQVRQDEPEACLCRPGLFEDIQGVCQTCPQNHFCIGDNTQSDCPDNSEAQTHSTTLFDCQCKVGFANASWPSLTCEQCVDGSTYKDYAGPGQCEACTVCTAAAPSFQYQKEACVYTANALCDACETCTNWSTGEYYVSQACTDMTNAVCSECSVCDYNVQWRQHACVPTDNTVCQLINFDPACPENGAAGFYRGQHTQTSNSLCAPCQYQDIKYMDHTLHTAKSHALVYNDPFSCRVQCLGHSKLRDVNNHSAGCISCETGNVLLKDFTVIDNNNGDQENCSFTCKGDYERITRTDGTEDCVTPPLKASTVNSFLHTVQITNIERDATGTLFTVLHTNHSRFLVVVGNQEPTSCKTVRGCCYANHWRVSLLRQAGFPISAISDSCSQEPHLISNYVDPATLTFSLPDAKLPEVASCTIDNTTQKCSLTVTLIDTLQWGVTSETLVMHSTRAGYNIFLSNKNQYIPLDAFTADVYHAYTLPTGHQVYLIKSRLSGPVIDATLRVTGMTQVLLGNVRDCARTHFQSPVTYSDSPIYTPDSEIATYWLGDSQFVTAFFALNLGPDKDQDIALVRNMTGILPLCTEDTHTFEFDLGHVASASGLGQNIIYNMNWLKNATETTSGELGTLATFIAQTFSNVATTISLKNLLVAYTTGTSATQAIDSYIYSISPTKMTNGTLDFTYDFRHTCRQQHGKCVHEYFTRNSAYNHLHYLMDCSTSSKDAARSWIYTEYGITHDHGHVDAICDKIALNPTHNAIAVLAHTQRFLNPAVFNQWSNSSSAPVKAFLWPNFAFESIA